MRQRVRVTGIWLVLAGPLLVALAVPTPDSAPQARAGSAVLARVRAEGALRFAVEPGELALFSHRGKPRGFEYDVLRGFAEGLDVRLELRPAGSSASVLERLRNGTADVAYLPWTSASSDDLIVVDPRTGGGDPSQNGALFVRHDAPDLAVALEAFLADPTATERLAALRQQYLENYRRFGLIEVAEGPRISAYDRLIVAHAAEKGFDWRLVAALIFVESSFRHDAVSPKGATGLMQLMPVHADARSLRDPEENIRLGVRYLHKLSARFPDSTGDDHLAIVLAAYLLGPGHVFDAQRIAVERGRDPHRWRGGLAEILPLLEDPAFVPRLAHGFARGKHAVWYVHRIFDRYEKYRERFREARVDDGSATG